jgi:hypothetical protein
VIEPAEIAAKTGYTRPHTVHCMPGDNIVISMLGDVEGKGAGGFAVLDAQTFEVKGRWEDGGERPSMNYDCWYQPRKNFHRSNGSYTAEPVITTDAVEVEGFPFPAPALITDLLVSMDDRFLYFSSWLHGELRQYDVSDPAHPRLTGQLQLGGLLGKPSDGDRDLTGGPQMIQLAMDGRRLYVTNSLYSTWDNQFYPGLRSWLMRVNCSPEGGMEIDRDFFVDIHDRPGGPARAHEVRLQGGDCTTEILQ